MWSLFGARARLGAQSKWQVAMCRADIADEASVCSGLGFGGAALGDGLLPLPAATRPQPLSAAPR
eukprot:1395978-Lingulodinium_polyedra.AAC.1